MYQNFIICIEAVAPILLMLMAGSILRHLTNINDSELSKFNSIVFHTLFPFLMFNNVYGTKISTVIDYKLVLFTILGIMIVYFGGMALTFKLESSPKSRGAMIQAIYRSNFVIMGLPVATNIYGSANVGTTAIMIAIVIPIYNILAVITLESFNGTKANMRLVFANILKNPLIIGALLGIIFAVQGWMLPTFVEKTVDSFAGAATPVALIILGASFHASSLKRGTRNVTVSVIMRLIIVPAIMLSIAALMGIRDISFVTLIAIFAAPCAVSSFTMALEMNSDAELAGNCVILTTLFSSFTMFGWLFLFKCMNMF